MKRRAAMVLAGTHAVAAMIGGALVWLVRDHLVESPLSATLMAAYSAEKVRLALEDGPLDAAEAASGSHLLLLEDLRGQLGDDAYLGDKLLTVSALAVRYEQGAHPAKARKMFEDARAVCRARGMTRCAEDDIRALGLRIIK